jgi:hypothetical protein
MLQLAAWAHSSSPLYHLARVLNASNNTSEVLALSRCINTGPRKLQNSTRCHMLLLRCFTVSYYIHIIFIFISTCIHIQCEGPRPYHIHMYLNIFKIYFSVSYFWPALATAEWSASKRNTLLMYINILRQYWALPLYLVYAHKGGTIGGFKVKIRGPTWAPTWAPAPIPTCEVGGQVGTQKSKLEVKSSPRARLDVQLDVQLDGQLCLQLRLIRISGCITSEVEASRTITEVVRAHVCWGVLQTKAPTCP